jgi:hypothetical protein
MGKLIDSYISINTTESIDAGDPAIEGNPGHSERGHSPPVHLDNHFAMAQGDEP